jgi:hypothetical protein
MSRTDPKFLEPRFAQCVAAVDKLDQLARKRFSRRVTGWSLDASAKAEIDRILRETITDTVGPEFMAPSARNVTA